MVAPLVAACKSRYHIGLYSEKHLEKEKQLKTDLHDLQLHPEDGRLPAGVRTPSRTVCVCGVRKYQYGAFDTTRQPCLC